jgi:uncharacterized membrane protein
MYRVIHRLATNPFLSITPFELIFAMKFEILIDLLYVWLFVLAITFSIFFRYIMATRTIVGEEREDILYNELIIL